ncbi:GTP-binding protein LepA [Nocardioides euryhalodurans]|uniref:GTP-binding protein LepA n=1 Tax=Nocardioides euryhalodurans TaxID=2518370 RepID=A0A4P7GLR7_9ACTN|nr:GTP-binding protein LepA [Nocardioides euryhalodurans]QBR92819.1 GTP-binding protein LepA [Nocardioides euryhalodurans]
MSGLRSTEQRLIEHVDRLGAEHPPIDLATVDFTVRDPAATNARFGHVLDYMARVELEVDRNVLELTTMLPDPPEVDRHFYADVWHPQEVRHGQILDELQVRLGRPAADTDLDTVSAKLHVLGALAHLAPVQDVVRMLYYLTGQATERSAVLAYNLLHDGLLESGERAAAETVVAQIRRQEPGHHAFYAMSARGLAEQLSPWQHWLVRRLRAVSFAPVGANDDEQRADFGEVMTTLGIDRDLERFATQVARVESELLGATTEGLPVPAYVVRAFREAVELAQARAAR